MAKKILVLEDEEELGRSIKRFLQQHNYQVTYFSDITRVESIGVEEPDLILTDLLMPRFHGFDICRAVKDDPQLKHIPLIAMTAVYKDAFHKLEAMRIGVSDFLEKPFKFSELLEKVEKFLGPTLSTEKPGAKRAKAAPPQSEPIEKIKEKQPTASTAMMPPKAKPHTLPEEDDIPPANQSKQKATSPPSTTEVEDKRDQVLLEQFSEMKQDYASQLPEKIIELEQIWGRVQRGYDTANELEKLRRKVHSLAGSGTSYSFKEISEYARQIELLVDMIIVEGENTIAQRKDKINKFMDDMRHHPIVSTELEIIRQMKKSRM